VMKCHGSPNFADAIFVCVAASCTWQADLCMVSYALNLWPALLRYCDDGITEIDNSAAERALRGIGIGRRNYLFAGADSGGARAAAIHSLIGQAQWCRPRGLVASCAGQYRRASGQLG